MIEAEVVLDQLWQAGFGLVTAVPCSYLTPLINGAIDSTALRFVNAANEGDAVAIASGSEIGGCRAVVMMQNSGLGNAVNPLSSLAIPFRTPMLLVVTWRGQPGAGRDEPQHELMGRMTTDLLELLGIPWALFPAEPRQFREVVNRALEHLEACETPFALVMPKAGVAPRGLAAHGLRDERMPQRMRRRRGPRQRHAQDEILRVVQESAQAQDLVVSTTGYTSRALYALGDRPNQLYIVGSMGCASSLALGLALTRPDRRVLLLDGDGAALMRPSAMAAIGREQPGNLVHILLDNGVHDSTGRQATLSATVDFPALALACGYSQVCEIDARDELERALRAGGRSLTFLHVKTLPRTQLALPRPTIGPAENAQRLRSWIQHHDFAIQPVTAS